MKRNFRAVILSPQIYTPRQLLRCAQTD